MLADLLIGLSLWTATSVLAALSLGRILQRKVQDDPLSNVA
jgi:hypothetical protein